MTECFWCGAWLTGKQRTKDHLVSKPLAAFLGIKRPCSHKWCVIACKPCNMERGDISNLLRTLRRLRTRLARPSGVPRRNLNKFWKQRVLLLPRISFYRERIVAKLEPDKAAMLLRELDELL